MRSCLLRRLHGLGSMTTHGRPSDTATIVLDSFVSMRVIYATVGPLGAREVRSNDTSRRHVLTALVPLVVLGAGATNNPRVASAALGKPVNLLHQTAEIDPSLTPDATLYDATDGRLRQAGRLIQQALNASTIEEEEQMWTQIIDEFSDVDAVWRDDVVGRCGYCNSRCPGGVP